MVYPVSHVGPVCALRTLETDGNLVLQGEGPLLKIHNIKRGKVIAQTQVFSRNKVHGIRAYETDKPKTVAVFGSRSLAIIEWNNITKPVKELGLGDWILAVEFSTDGSSLYCLTAHNVVITVDVASRTLIRTTDCGWKSILYSGCVRALKDGRIIVCAGTVMDGVLVWDLKSATILTKLVGHDGSIFYVEMSKCGRYIASCSDDRCIKVWDASAGSLLGSGWGHGARIWGLAFFDASSEGFSLFSCSEDCTARIWRYSSGDLVQQRLINCHSGKNVWSEAVNDQLKVAFTGGADGKLQMHSLVPETKRELAVNFKDYYDYGEGLYGVTEEGEVIIAPHFERSECIHNDSKYSQLAGVVGSEDIAVIGERGGEILVVKGTKKTTFQVPVARLGNILVCHQNPKTLLVLAESFNPKEPLQLLKIDTQSLDVVSVHSLERPPFKVTVSDMAYSGCLLVGCKYAILLQYDSQKLSGWYKNEVQGNTVSGMVGMGPNTFGLTVRDKKYYVVRVSDKLRILQDNKLAKGILEGLFWNESRDLFLYGFRSDEFCVWNETTQTEVARIASGGPHMKWSFKYWIDAGVLKYRFVSETENGLQIVENATSPVLEAGLHGQEVRSIAVVDNKVISGGEDTTVRLSQLQPDGSLRLKSTQRQHGSGVQAVHPVNGDYVISSSAREEVFLWRLEEDYMTLYQTIKPLSAHPDLRVMDFDTIEIKESGASVGFVLVTVYSDSQIHLWYFNYKEKSFKRIASHRYRTCCILWTRFVILEGLAYLLIASTNGYLSVYGLDVLSPYFKLKEDHFETVSTAFKVANLGSLILDQPIHQSSIKSADVRQVSDTEVEILTGGDDCALKVSRLVKCGDRITFTSLYSQLEAAASTITSVLFTPTQILSISVDQKVRLWTNQLALLEDNYTTVADTGCAALTSAGQLLIGGAGLSVWNT